ncbi:unnamed protein product [Boreogadus saida]
MKDREVQPSTYHTKYVSINIVDNQREDFRQRSVVKALSVMRLLGMMSATHTVVPLGLLHMRRLQRWFSRLRIDPVRQRRRKVTITLSVGPDWTHWGDP